MTRQVINPDELFNSVQFGFSQITIGTGSRIVTVSGQVAWDKDMNIVGKHDFAVQIIKAFENLSLAMTAAGGSMDDVLSLRIYMVQRVMPQHEAVRNALKQFFPENPPTTTQIVIPALANEDFLVEIEAFAVLT